MMVGSNLKDQQLQQIVDKTIMEADHDGDGRISFEEFARMVESTDVNMSMTLGECGTFYPAVWKSAHGENRSILIYCSISHYQAYMPNVPFLCVVVCKHDASWSCFICIAQDFATQPPSLLFTGNIHMRLRRGISFIGIGALSRRPSCR